MKNKTSIISIAILGLMFFIFGFVSWVNAILIPYFKIACELTHFQSYLVAFAFYVAYFFMSVPSSLLLDKVGFKKGMMIGFFSMAIGAFLFVPAALTRAYPVFLSGLFLIGTGLALLQTAANPYVTIVGPIERAAQRISIMGICNKIAGILAPLVFAAVVLKVTDSELFRTLESGTLAVAEKNHLLDELIRRVIFPYSVLGVMLVAVGILVRFSPLPELNTEQSNKEELAEGEHGKTSIFQFPYLVLGALAIFFHVGSQIIAIDTIIGYARTMGLDLLEAKVFPSYVLGATMCGYFVGVITIPRFINQRNALLVCTLLGLVLSAAVLIFSGSVNVFGHQTDISIWFLAALGLPNSLIYANIWPLAIKGLGRFTKLGSSIMIMGLCGNALTPVLYGIMADHFSVRSAYLILIPCYMYLVFFAAYGYRIKRWRPGVAA
ncbi:sugar MFS transporter [Maribellus sp. YY47]|uniref:sugar MFS transporter n=1 Tax=Maribellus sp. YY47 TaxID=2929486 RepID=UPI002001B617|nr:sugar MFS transporter [Maribellus sp. YY47]